MLSHVRVGSVVTETRGLRGCIAAIYDVSEEVEDNTKAFTLFQKNQTHTHLPPVYFDSKFH